jgi:hypothetical protein
LRVVLRHLTPRGTLRSSKINAAGIRHLHDLARPYSKVTRRSPRPCLAGLLQNKQSSGVRPLCRTAPDTPYSRDGLHLMPFLTDLDERAQVKGSRDPLGLVPLWSKFGREVVGNLTTVSRSVRGFTTLLVALDLADMLRDQLRGEAPEPLEIFLRFEQLAGYARFKCNQDREVLGLRRVAQRVNEGRRIRISSDSNDQILSNQKMYGLWGFFTVPARSSGLLVPGDSRLTDDARKFVERHYYPILGNRQGVNSLRTLLRRESYDLRHEARDAALLNAIGRMHSRRLRAEERTFYRDHLAWGGPDDSTQGRQRALADILSGTKTQDFGFPEFRAVQKKAEAAEALASALVRIGLLERLIAPAALVFGFLQNRHGQTTPSVARQIAETWERPLRLDVAGIRRLQPDIAGALQSKEESELWIALSEALSGAEYMRVIELLVAINTSVMQRRHGAAGWIVIEAGKIRVRLADERAELTSVEDAEERWRSTYFINSLWRIAREVNA